MRGWPDTAAWARPGFTTGDFNPNREVFSTPMQVDLIVLIVGFLFGFYMAWNIGANDVANSMATAVGAK